MKVSVITASFNAAETIGETLRSVAAQDWPDIEHIVIDGASRDTTSEIVAEHQRAGGIYISEPDRGIYDAMNKGIAMASGDIIGLLNADDIYAGPDTISHVVKSFKRHRTDAILGDVGHFRSGASNRVVRRYDSSRFTPGRIAWGWMPAHPAMFLTRAAYDRAGPYRTDYRIAADYEFVARAFGRLGLSYQHLPEILVKMRIGGVSTSGWRSAWVIIDEARRGCLENNIYTNYLMLATKYPWKLLEYVR